MAIRRSFYQCRKNWGRKRQSLRELNSSCGRVKEKTAASAKNQICVHLSDYCPLRNAWRCRNAHILCAPQNHSDIYEPPHHAAMDYSFRDFHLAILNSQRRICFPWGYCSHRRMDVLAPYPGHAVFYASFDFNPACCRANFKNGKHRGFHENPCPAFKERDKNCRIAHHHVRKRP